MGFAESMNAVLRSNKTLRQNLHRRDEHFNLSKLNIKRRKNIRYDFPKASKTYLESVRKTTIDDKMKQTVKWVFILLLSIMITAFLIALLFIINY